MLQQKQLSNLSQAHYIETETSSWGRLSFKVSGQIRIWVRVWHDHDILLPLVMGKIPVEFSEQWIPENLTPKYLKKNISCKYLCYFSLKPHILQSVLSDIESQWMKLTQYEQPRKQFSLYNNFNILVSKFAINAEMR